MDTERSTRMEVEALDRWLGKKCEHHVPIFFSLYP